MENDSEIVEEVYNNIFFKPFIILKGENKRECLSHLTQLKKFYFYIIFYYTKYVKH